MLARKLRNLLSLALPRVKVLAYHAVSPEPRDPYEVSSSQFKLQMEYLSDEKYCIISLERAYSYLKEGTIPDKAVVITFDDAFSCLVDHAFPILKRHCFPASVFIPISFVGRADSFSYENERGDFMVMTWEQMIDSTQFGIQYGSHSMSHKNLLELDDVDLMQELQESKRILLEHIPSSFFPFAYPFGMYSEEVMTRCEDAGYHCALCFGNVLGNSQLVNPYEIKREKVLASTSIDEFQDIVNIKKDLSRKLKKVFKVSLLSG